MKDSIVRKVQQQVGRPMTLKQAEDVFTLVFALVCAELLRKGRGHVPGFGVFRLTTRKARQIRNPKTGELMQLPLTRSVAFRPAKEFAAVIRSLEVPPEVPCRRSAR